MKLKIYNSKSKSKENFTPINKNKIRMYVCGPTVYDRVHIGNARPVIVFDLLYRLLKLIYNDKSITYIRNITDVDDKIIEASKKNKRDINEITKEVTKIFHKNCESLNCLKPTVEPKGSVAFGSIDGFKQFRLLQFS